MGQVYILSPFPTNGFSDSASGYFHSKFTNAVTNCRCTYINWKVEEGKKEMFHLTTHSTHFIYGYMASDIW